MPEEKTINLPMPDGKFIEVKESDIEQVDYTVWRPKDILDDENPPTDAAGQASAHSGEPPKGPGPTADERDPQAYLESLMEFLGPNTSSLEMGPDGNVFHMLKHCATHRDMPDIDAKMKAMLRDNVRACRRLGDLQHRAQQRLAELACNGDDLKCAALAEHGNHLRRQLAGEHATPLEQFCINHLILVWQTMNAITCQVASSKGDIESRTLQQALESGEKRLLTAMKTLELAKKISANRSS